jgi:hypothetical protein
MRTYNPSECGCGGSLSAVEAIHGEVLIIECDKCDGFAEFDLAEQIGVLEACREEEGSASPACRVVEGGNGPSLARRLNGFEVKPSKSKESL